MVRQFLLRSVLSDIFCDFRGTEMRGRREPGSAGADLHNRTGEDNADAHFERQIMGREVAVAIAKAQLDLVPWEQIIYGEFDGRRRKRVLVKIIGE